MANLHVIISFKDYKMVLISFLKITVYPVKNFSSLSNYNAVVNTDGRTKSIECYGTMQTTQLLK